MNILTMTRLLKGVSQGQLARAVDISPAMISRIEHDLLRNSPSVIRLKIKIAAALDVPAEFIFPDLNDEHRKKDWKMEGTSVGDIRLPVDILLLSNRIADLERRISELESKGKRT